ncbi:MAG: SpoIID/LytB domain-containing protein [Candidatus Eisenbacteria bacterium]|nr:SpoIID/LytB domain-containing protein [Candidatus Eisenbacteria bacterium]
MPLDADLLAIAAPESRRPPAGSFPFLLLVLAIVSSAAAGESGSVVPAGRSGPPPTGRSAIPHDGPVVRIGLLVGVPDCTIRCEGGVRIWRRGSGLRGSRFGPGVTLRMRAARVEDRQSRPRGQALPLPGWGVRLSLAPRGALGTFPEELLIEPLSSAHPLWVDGCSYRGEILVRAGAPERLNVINAVRLEDYLRGVVPLEIGSEGVAPAAMRAQAIAARSYALFYLGRRAAAGCDLFAGPDDQVYGGIPAETDAATRAVVATRGIVAVWEGLPIRANYCSTCGGATESSDRVWPGESYPYLRAVRDRDGDDCFCEASRYFRWKERWSCAQLQQIIREHLPREVPAARGGDLGALTGLKAKRRSPSGRIELLEIQMEGGRFRVRADRIRWVLRRPDGGLLRSTWIGKLQVDRDTGCHVTLEGAGYGHGVGMCQMGARELARRGLSAPQILRHYYRGITFARWW